MEIHIDDETDAEIAQAIATAVAEHLGTTVELKARDGSDLARAGEDWDEEGTVVTDREERLREEIEGVLSGGPERGFEKIESLGKLFVRDRLDLVFDEIAYEDGTFARYGDDSELPADGLLTGVGVIDGRKVAFTANDYTVKTGSLGGWAHRPPSTPCSADSWRGWSPTSVRRSSRAPRSSSRSTSTSGSRPRRCRSTNSCRRGTCPSSWSPGSTPSGGRSERSAPGTTGPFYQPISSFSRCSSSASEIRSEFRQA
jgi:hypothetical protein